MWSQMNRSQKNVVSIEVSNVEVSNERGLKLMVSNELVSIVMEPEEYMTAFRHKFIHNSITQSKTSKSIMAANGQRSTPTGDYYITHYMNVQDDVLYNARRCTATTLN